MSKKITITLRFDEDLTAAFIQEHPEYIDFRIVSKSLDARNAPRGRVPCYHYQLEAIKTGEQFSSHSETFSAVDDDIKQSIKPIIVGLGPAGLFAALRLLEYGITSVIVERGAPAAERMKDIAKYWRYGILNEQSNVCFGEGGAGLFSDGKLITRIKSPYIQYVMDKLVDFGAPENVAYESNPHLGSNRMRRLIIAVSTYLKAAGCEIHYRTQMSDFIFSSSGNIEGMMTSEGQQLVGSDVILATGHSAEDVYLMLERHKVAMRPKDFAIGVRVEHPRMLINKMQYGAFKQEELGAARYRLSNHDKESDRGCFSFCMCPGGHVLSSSTQADGLVVNGMSNFHHNSKWSNSALVVSVKAGRDYSDTNIAEALSFQRKIEQRAFVQSCERASGRELPAVNISDFMLDRSSRKLVKSSTPSGIFAGNFEQIFPEFITAQLRMALKRFDQKMKGFISSEALLIAPETRTSSCVTIKRNREELSSAQYSNLYPCGEGAGYAGGITSSAVDGIRVVEALLEKHRNA